MKRLKGFPFRVSSPVFTGDSSCLGTLLSSSFRRTAALHGCAELTSAPLVEPLSLFQRALGSDTDVVQKEMFGFTTKGREEVVLRPEATASVARSFLQENRHFTSQHSSFSTSSSGSPQLSTTSSAIFYEGPMFRYERPQRGRMRQFQQFGVEFLSMDTNDQSGSSIYASPEDEAESIALACRSIDNFFLSLHNYNLLPQTALHAIHNSNDSDANSSHNDSSCIFSALNIHLHYNYLGDAKGTVIEAYTKALVDYFSQPEIYTRLSQLSQERLTRGAVLRIFDSKESTDRKLLKEIMNDENQQDSTLKGIPKLESYLTDDCLLRRDRVLMTLHELIPSHWVSRLVLNPSLVRGLDYYSGSVFEIVTGGESEKNQELTVLAGGRYDGLFRQLANPRNRKECQQASRCHGLGWALGIDRFLEIMNDYLAQRSDDETGNTGKRTEDGRKRRDKDYIKIRLFGIVEKKKGSRISGHDSTQNSAGQMQNSDGENLFLPRKLSKALAKMSRIFQEDANEKRIEDVDGRKPEFQGPRDTIGSAVRFQVAYDCITPLSKQLRMASKNDIDFCIFLGTDEIGNDIDSDCRTECEETTETNVRIRDMEKAEEIIIKLNKEINKSTDEWSRFRKRFNKKKENRKGKIHIFVQHLKTELDKVETVYNKDMLCISFIHTLKTLGCKLDSDNLTERVWQLLTSRKVLLPEGMILNQQHTILLNPVIKLQRELARCKCELENCKRERDKFKRDLVACEKDLVACEKERVKAKKRGNHYKKRGDDYKSKYHSLRNGGSEGSSADYKKRGDDYKSKYHSPRNGGSEGSSKEAPIVID
eukprot:g1146.t1